MIVPWAALWRPAAIVSLPLAAGDWSALVRIEQVFLPPLRNFLPLCLSGERELSCVIRSCRGISSRSALTLPERK